MQNATWYDILSLSLLSINVILTFYVCYLCNKIPEFVLTSKYKLFIKMLMNGIAFIEVLFLISLHSWILNDMGASIGYLDSFSSLIYTIAENVKSLFFLTIIIMVIKWIRIKLNFVKECTGENVK